MFVPRTRTMVWVAAGVALHAMAQPVTAQGQRVSGTAIDVDSERPIQGAVVRVGVGDRAVIAATDQLGVFALTVTDTGAMAIEVRRLGFEPVRATIHVPSQSENLTIAMRRIASLDTVRVLAARQGIFGIVAAWGEDMTPVPGARVSILGESTRQIKVDSSARFFVPIRTPGTYVVRATADGYAPTTMSVAVSANEGTEVALLLDSASGRSPAVLEVAYDDFRRRLLEKTSASALIPRAELGTAAKPRLVDVIRESPSFARRGLRFSEFACVFVDGRPRAGLSINALDPTVVEFVEVYGPRGDRSATLLRAWPKGFPCAPTGMARSAPGTDVVQWVVIWIRH